MLLRDLLEVVDRFDEVIEVRTGNEMYSDVVLELPRIRKWDEAHFESEYLDYEVCNVEAVDYLEMRIWIYKD